MNVILLNDNPVVSRLVKLSLEKIGYKLEEVSSLVQIEGKSADIFICDSGVADENVDYTSYGNQVLFLVPRNFEKKLGKNSLEKPFLPTDFIDFIQKLSMDPLAQKQKEQEDGKREKLIQTGFDDEVKKADDLDLDFEEVADLDDIFGDDKGLENEQIEPNTQTNKQEINELNQELIEPETSLEEVLGSQITKKKQDIEEANVNEELGEESLAQSNAQEISQEQESELKEENTSLSDKEMELAQLSSMLDEIDSMDEEKIFDDKHTDELKDFDSISGFIPPQEENVQNDEVVGEEFEDMKAISDEDKEQINTLADELVEKATKDENTEDLADESLADEVSEDLSDENLAENLADEESMAEESMANENLGEGLLDEKNLIEKESPAELVEVDENLAENVTNEITVDEKNADEIAEDLSGENLADNLANNESIADENLANENQADENPGENKQSDQVEQKSANDELDALSEAEIASALGIESFDEYREKAVNEKSLENATTVLEKSANEAKTELDSKALENAKNEISSKITETLGATLANSSIKEAIKGMKIKINISFEN